MVYFSFGFSRNRLQSKNDKGIAKTKDMFVCVLLRKKGIMAIKNITSNTPLFFLYSIILLARELAVLNMAGMAYNRIAAIYTT